MTSKLEVPQAMKLKLCLGYDGPVKAWIDGKEVFHDPKGTNPAWEDRAKVPFDPAPGTHDVLVALGSNQCNAWGIFLRFERLDVTKKQIAQKRRLFLKVCLRCGARNALQATRCRKCHASVLRLKNRSVGLKK